MEAGHVRKLKPDGAFPMAHAQVSTIRGGLASLGRLASSRGSSERLNRPEKDTRAKTGGLRAFKSPTGRRHREQEI